MVKQQLRTGDVLNEDILTLYETMPRHEFVSPEYADFAYSDMQIPLPHGQRMLTPLEEGQILQNTGITSEEVVLEIGTGSGFFTALLSRQCKKVISIDYFADFTEKAQIKLAEHQCENVELYTGDACRGWLEMAPYNIIIFTGAIEELTETHKLQLLPGGRLFAIIGTGHAMQGQLHQLDHNGNWTKSILFETEIPPLIDKLKPKEFKF